MAGAWWDAVRRRPFTSKMSSCVFPMKLIPETVVASKSLRLVQVCLPASSMRGVRHMWGLSK